MQIPSLRKICLWFVLLLVLVQLVPYGRGHKNPPLVKEPAWDTMETRELVKRACFDCHSNETEWPWYSWVAPVSWLVQRDVDNGRAILNFSDWQIGKRQGENPAKLRAVILEGRMPHLRHRLVESESRLSEAEREQLLRGLMTTTGGR